MKKLFALLLALMSLFSATVSTADAVVVDRPETYKVVEWAIGYSKRCRGYCGKITKTSPPIRQMAKRIAMAPLSLLIGTACAEDAAEDLMADAKIPKPVIETVKSNFDSLKLNEVVATNNVEALTSLPGIGKKRASVIIKALMPITKIMRIAKKAITREKTDAFTLRTFPAEELFRNVLEELAELCKFRASKDDPDATKEAVEKLEAIKPKLLAAESMTVRRNQGKITRMSASKLTDILKIKYNEADPCEELMVIEHGISKMLNFHWSLFSSDEKEGNKMRDDLIEQVYKRIGRYGVKVINTKDETKNKLYGGFASSAAHQKKERLLMCEVNCMKAHAYFIWLGKTFNHFVTNSDMTGAEFWKIRANIIRPRMKDYETADGKKMTHRDILVVPDVKKMYIFLNARRVGGIKGAMFKDGEDTEKVILGDGAAISIVRIKQQGQGGTIGFKWMLIDGTSSIEALCKKHGITVEDFMNAKVKGIDGKMHRIGDYKVICGEGCWKFDKCFDNYEAYCEWMDNLNKMYPGIANLSLLRQSEDIEGETKIRRLTRSLIQQWLTMSLSEQMDLTRKARKDLKRNLTLKGAIRKMAALYKNYEERTPLEKLFYVAPWLVTHPSFQQWWKEVWMRRFIEACSGKFRTEGQYPYIMQDPVALLEVWVLGVDPDSEELGILKGDEVSVADVPDRRNLVCIRFPANFLTAKVMTNVACIKEFSSCGNIAILSVHSDILIMQDGDVDGDEMCILYNWLAIRLTRRMIREINPPVILFNHGDKPQRKPFGGREGYIDEVYSALWRAKKFDSVGINANLAMICAYLASIDKYNGDVKRMAKHLLWMSIASTAAILAIDQVKGVKVDETLLKYIESIKKDILKELKDIAMSMGVDKKAAYKCRYPFVQQFVNRAKKRDVGLDAYMPMNMENVCDSITSLIINDVFPIVDGHRVYHFNMQGAHWNKLAATQAILNHRVHTRKVMNGVVTQDMLEKIGANWFRRATKQYEKDMDAKYFSMARPGCKVSLKETAKLLWRNEMSMAYSMDGTNLADKKAEYHKTVKQILYDLADSVEWKASAYDSEVKEGYIYTSEEKHASVANAFLTDALELGDKGNNIDQKGGWMMFILDVFADEARENVVTNKVAHCLFFGEEVDMEDLELDETLNVLSDNEELFEEAPVNPEPEELEEEVPQQDYEYSPSDEELEEMAAIYGNEDIDYGYSCEDFE